MDEADRHQSQLISLKKPNLKELGLFFLRLGTTAFGGPAAHIAIMEDEVVRRRRWVTREKFLDLLGAASLIPGPSSTEMAIFIGYLCKGWAGLLLGASVLSLRQWLSLWDLPGPMCDLGIFPKRLGYFTGSNQ